jgi:hypothetical protein
MMSGLLRSSWPERGEGEKGLRHTQPRPSGRGCFVSGEGHRYYLIDAERALSLSPFASFALPIMNWAYDFLPDPL